MNYREKYKKYVNRELLDATVGVYKFKNKSIAEIANSVWQILVGDWQKYLKKYMKYKPEKIDEVLNGKMMKFYSLSGDGFVDISTFYDNAGKAIKSTSSKTVLNPNTAIKDKMIVIQENMRIEFIDVEGKGPKYCIETWLKGFGGTKLYNDFCNALKVGTLYYSDNSTPTPLSKNEKGEMAQKGRESKFNFKWNFLLENTKNGILDLSNGAYGGDIEVSTLNHLIKERTIKGLKISINRGDYRLGHFVDILSKQGEMKCKVTKNDITFYFK